MGGGDFGGKIDFCCFKPPGLWDVFPQPQETDALPRVRLAAPSPAACPPAQPTVRSGARPLPPPWRRPPRCRAPLLTLPQACARNCTNCPHPPKPLGVSQLRVLPAARKVAGPGPLASLPSPPCCSAFLGALLCLSPCQMLFPTQAQGSLLLSTICSVRLTPALPASCTSYSPLPRAQITLEHTVRFTNLFV